jgi:long-chain acyl-CoA synthetase
MPGDAPVNARGGHRTQNGNVAVDLVTSAAASGSLPALMHGESVWNYTRLADEAARFAATCRVHDVDDGDRVALVIGGWPEHVACWYGALMAGAVVVDVSTLLGDDELSDIIRDAAPRLAVSDRAYADRTERVCLDAGTGTSIVVVDGPGHGVPEVDHPSHRDGLPDRSIAQKGDDDLAVIAYTSGTTGRPKGVMHSHGALRRQLELLSSLQYVGPGDFVYQAVPLFPIHGFLPQVANAIRGGAAVILADKFSAVDFAQASRRHPVTYFTSAPPILQRMLELPEDELPLLGSLRVVTCGGAPLQPESRRRFENAIGVHLTQGYGMTEMMGAFVADYDDAPVGSCGRQHPAAPALVVVLDDDGRRVAPGQVGEIAVHRSCVCIGYWNDADRTREALEGNWFRTGDIGWVDTEGYYFVVDRKKDMIIRGGFNIYSAEIERVLDERPEVEEAIVIGVPDDALGEVPMAYVVAVEGFGAERLAGELEAYVRARLGSLKSVRAVRIVSHGDLPRNALGKVLKRELRAAAAVGSAPPPFLR